MSGTHARPRWRRGAAPIATSTPQACSAADVVQTSADAPQVMPPQTPSVPFDGRRRPLQAVAQPLGPRPTSSPDPDRDAPVDAATEALYRGIQAHFDQYRQPFDHAV